jgi:leucyl aminopeptidase (aminopeptidase T)
MADSPIATDRTRRLARLAVELGANVAPGQDVVVLAWDVEHAGLAREIAEAAYRAGAHYVSVLYWDQHVKRSRLEHAEPDSLGYTPALVGPSHRGVHRAAQRIHPCVRRSEPGPADRHRSRPRAGSL